MEDKHLQREKSINLLGKWKTLFEPRCFCFCSFSSSGGTWQDIPRCLNAAPRHQSRRAQGVCVPSATCRCIFPWCMTCSFTQCINRRDSAKDWGPELGVTSRQDKQKRLTEERTTSYLICDRTKKVSKTSQTVGLCVINDCETFNVVQSGFI